MAQTTGGGWKATILAGLANYIDAGSIVASAAALALWVKAFGLTPGYVGLIGALGANAVSAGIGAYVGGRLCDRFGRKKIYQFDMLFYAFGMCWLVLASAPWMILVGSVLVGLAVGADIPASWSLIAEQAPANARGKHSGAAQVLWNLGPVVVLVAAFVLAPLGLTGIRIVFGHLLVLALLLTLLRSKMAESQVWEEARAAEATTAPAKLFTGRNLRAMAFLILMYGLWNLWAGTHGFFFPYILSTVGNQSQAMSVALIASSFVLGMLSVWFVFMPLVDRVNQRLLFGIAAAMQVAGMLLLALFPLTLGTAVLYILLTSVGLGFGAQPFFQLWSSELFPTLQRSTAQGITFAVVRIGLGAWSFFVPILTATGFTTLAWILTGFLTASGLIGVIWAPDTKGRSLAELDARAVNT